MTRFYPARMTVRWTVGRAMRIWAAFGFILTVANFVSAQHAQAATLSVNPTLPSWADSGDCVANACKTITYAISQANPIVPDTILLVAETYYSGSGEYFPLLINKSLTITGAGTGTRIDAAGTNQSVITINSGTVTISGVTITGGNIGILNYGALTLDSSTVSGNTAHTGAGMYIVTGTVFLRNSTVSGNHAYSSAGGIRNHAGTVTLDGSTVSNNKAENDSGGIINGTGTMTLNRSTVSGNRSLKYIGGIRNDSGTVTLTNSTVSDNKTGAGGWQGGGIVNGLFFPGGGGTVTLNNSTVTLNVASGAGGGIFNAVGTVRLKNTIVANNTASSGANCSGTITTLWFNLSNDGTCSLSTSVGDKFPSNPLLGPLANNGGSTQTHALLANSPAMNGVPAVHCTDAIGGPINIDQRGNPRLQGTGCEIGSVEGSVLQILKQVVNTLGAPTPATFDISFKCSPSGPNAASVLVPPGNVGSTFFNIAPNSQCKFDEAPLPPIPNLTACNGGSASWVATYAPSQTVAIPANAANLVTVTVTNTLTCGPLNGTFTVYKIHTTPPPSGTTFNITGNCTGYGSFGFSYTGSLIGFAIPGVPYGSICTIQEPTLPPPFTNAQGKTCTWQQNASQNQTVTINSPSQSVTMTNSYTCV